jgi:hypothetical protein
LTPTRPDREGRVLINAQTGGPLSRANQKIFLTLSSSQFDP